MDPLNVAVHAEPTWCIVAQKRLLTALNGCVKTVTEHTNCTEHLICNANKQQTCTKYRKGILAYLHTTYKLLAYVTVLHVPAALQSYAMSQQKQPSFKTCNHTQCLSRGNLASKYAAICLYPNRPCRHICTVSLYSSSSFF